MKKDPAHTERNQTDPPDFLHARIDEKGLVDPRPVGSFEAQPFSRENGSDPGGDVDHPELSPESPADAESDKSTGNDPVSGDPSGRGVSDGHRVERESKW